jgi:hypothetical protein
MECFDMRPIGFSTGALALGDFRGALGMLKSARTKAVELSALRDHEVDPLMKALPDLDLSGYSYVSVHVPSGFRSLTEADVAARLRPCIDREIAVVMHPDAIKDPKCWASFGPLLCIENMDKRKCTGRTVSELESFFSIFPDATFCLDIAHARQIDSTMDEARLMLRRFGTRLRQIHISEIDGQGHHHGLSWGTILASRTLARLIGQEIPIIIESQIPQKDIAKEIAAVEQALTPAPKMSTGELADWGELA